MDGQPASSLSNEEISAPPPCGLEYTYFMKIGQPKLSERKRQKGGVFVPLTTDEPRDA
jgi:hypothetical protein